MTGIDIKPDAQGKVRDLYDLGDRLLLVATDPSGGRTAVEKAFG